MRLYVQVIDAHTEKSSPKFCVCVLTGGERESASLNLNFGSGETIQFFTEGATVPVHLTGYYNVQDLDFEEDMSNDEEDGDIVYSNGKSALKQDDSSDDEDEEIDSDDEDLKELKSMLENMDSEERAAFLAKHGIFEEEDDDSDDDEEIDSDDEDVKELKAALESMDPEERAAFLAKHGIFETDSDEEDDDFEPSESALNDSTDQYVEVDSEDEAESQVAVKKATPVKSKPKQDKKRRLSSNNNNNNSPASKNYGNSKKRRKSAGKGGR